MNPFQKLPPHAMGFLYRVLSLEWLVVLAAAPFLTFPTVRPRWTVVALVVLAGWWLLRWAVRREPWPLTPFNGALLLFALMLPVGIRASAAPEITFPEASRVLLGVATFRAAALAVQDRRSLAFGVFLLCLLSLLITGVGLLGAQWSGKVAFLRDLVGRLPRLISTLPEDQGTPGINPNHLAGALVLYTSLAVALVLGWPLSRRFSLGSVLLFPLFLAFLALMGGVLLLTQSRSGWIGGMVGILGFLTLAGLSAHRRWERVLGIILLLLTVGLVAALVLHIGPERVGELLNGGEPSGIEKAVGIINMAGRVEIWDRALYAIQDFPFTGCGLGTFRRVVWMLYPLFTVPPDTDIGHAHNIFLQTALDLGIPGLIAYLALLVIAGAICWRAARRGDPLTRPIAVGLASGLLALHAYGMTDALALGSKPAVVFWFALGLVAALENIRAHSGGTAR